MLRMMKEEEEILKDAAMASKEGNTGIGRRDKFRYERYMRPTPPACPVRRGECKKEKPSGVKLEITVGGVSGESQVSEIARSSIEKSEMKSARRNGLSRIGVIEASDRTLR